MTEELLRSVSASLPMPSILRLSVYYRLPHKRVILSRKNILRRDGNRCQYCGRGDLPLTIDHVIPRTRGGDETWENLVCACMKCNNKKGDHTPGRGGHKTSFEASQAEPCNFHQALRRKSRREVEAVPFYEVEIFRKLGAQCLIKKLFSAGCALQVNCISVTGQAHSKIGSLLQNDGGYSNFHLIADYHVLTTNLDSSQIYEYSIEMILDWLAAGIDPEHSPIFRQSQIKEHAELHLIFSMLITQPRLERNPTLKEQIRDLNLGPISYGYLGYPVLQAADILLVQRRSCAGW